MYGRDMADPDGYVWGRCGWTRQRPLGRPKEIRVAARCLSIQDRILQCSNMALERDGRYRAPAA